MAINFTVIDISDYFKLFLLRECFWQMINNNKFKFYIGSISTTIAYVFALFLTFVRADFYLSI